MSGPPAQRELSTEAQMIVAMANACARRRGAAELEPVDLLMGAAETDLQTSLDLIGDVVGRPASEYREELFERLDTVPRRRERTVYEAVPWSSTSAAVLARANAKGVGPVAGSELVTLAADADAGATTGSAPAPLADSDKPRSFRLTPTVSERKVLASPVANALSLWILLEAAFLFRLSRIEGVSSVPSVTPVVWFLLAAPVAWILAVILHELGHAVVGIATGGRIASIHLGSGRQVGVVALGRTRFVLHAIPSEGRVHAIHTKRGRAGMLAYDLAGAAVNAVTVVILFRWHPDTASVMGAAFPPAFPAAAVAREAALIGSLTACGFALLPVAPKLGRLGTDGWNALQLLRWPAGDAARSAPQPAALDDGSMLLGDRMVLALQGGDGALGPAATECVVALIDHRWDDGAVAARRALEVADDRLQRAVLWNILATCSMLSDPSVALPEATDLAQRSVEHSEGPLREMAECTLALALVLSGQLDDAAQLLPDPAGLHVEGYAVVLLTQAMIDHRRGDTDTARSTYHRVSRRVPDSELLELAGADLGLDPPSPRNPTSKVLAFAEVSLFFATLAALAATA